MKENLPDFWPWGIWPPSSPDLNPLDYAMWGTVESKARGNPHGSVVDMKAVVEREWANISEDFVRRAYSRFWPRLRAMLAVDGGHFGI